MPCRKRFLLYCQHLSGSGHYVRTYEIARALAEAHHVSMVDGGRPVPRPGPDIPVERVVLPRICRTPAGITPMDSSQQADEVMRLRLQQLKKAVDRIRPDTLLVEHFPFSKWALYDEIVALIAHVRKVNKQARVVCSLRDISPRTRDDPEPGCYQQQVLDVLHTHFDAVLIHADPELVRMEESVPWMGSISIPIHYTGYVSEKPQPEWLDDDRPRGSSANNNGIVLVSAGGAGSIGLAAQCITAWRLPRMQAVTQNRRLMIFLPLFVAQDTLTELAHDTDGQAIDILPFTPDFLHWLQAADLSVSEAGYNTCTNILETCTPAILVPSPVMSDQQARAQRLAQRGLATLLDPADMGADTLATAILDTLLSDKLAHDIDLAGAHRTRELLETLWTRFRIF